MKKTKGTPQEIDVHVGARLREVRTQAGVSQEKLADAIGITFQQIQKYERGTNRIAAGRLAAISRVLKHPVSGFFPEEFWDYNQTLMERIDAQAREIQHLRDLVKGTAKNLIEAVK